METHCPRKRVSPLRVFSLSGTGVQIMHLVGHQHALPYSQEPHFGWSHLPEEVKTDFLPKIPEQSIHWTVVKLRCPKQKCKVKRSF